MKTYKVKELGKPISGKKITGIVKMGGYHFWNWRFPFRHLKKEELLIFYADALYKIVR